MDDRSRKTMHRVMTNDPTLIKLEIGGNSNTRLPNFLGGGLAEDCGIITSLVSSHDYATLGTSIGTNTYIKSLTVNEASSPRHERDDEERKSMIADELLVNLGYENYKKMSIKELQALTEEDVLPYVEAQKRVDERKASGRNITLSVPTQFIDGLKRNSSITSLFLVNWLSTDRSLVDGVGYDILKVYQKGTLTELSIFNCDIPTLHPMTSLKEITLYKCNITDEQLLPIVESMRHTSLEKLSMGDNIIGNVGCMTLASLLEDPSCNLYSLDLSGNNIEEAASLVNSLVGNKKMKHLYLGNNPAQTSAQVLSSGIRTLCDTSSINNIYLSNHTLDLLSLPDPEQNVEPKLRSLLGLNKEANKSHVAIRKILLFHPNIDIKVLFDWDIGGEWTLKALPYILDWLNRAGEAVVDEFICNATRVKTLIRYTSIN